MPMGVLACDLAARGLAAHWHAADHLQVRFESPAAGGGVACHGTSDGATFLSVVASGSLRVPEALRRRAAELLAAVTAGLPPAAGVFEVDAGDGEVRCRVSRGLAAAAAAPAAAASDAPLAAALTEGAWREALAAAARQYHVLSAALALLLQRHVADFAHLDAAAVASLAADIVAEIDAGAAAADAEAAAAAAATFRIE